MVLLLGSSGFWTTRSASFLQGPGRVRVEPRDRVSNVLVAARLYVTDLSDVPCTPPGVIACDRRDEHHFIANGSVEFELAAGDYRLVVERGTE